MNVITLLNEKGGVGKTTLATHIAAGLAIRGQRVVLIDADAQANSTTQLGLEEDGGLYQLLVKFVEWADLLKVAPYPSWQAITGENKGKLFVLPSNIETRVIPMLVDDATLLRERLNELRNWADTVVIDTSPTPSMLHTQIYMATRYLVYPSTCEMLGLEGLTKSIDHMEKLNKNRALFDLPAASLMGVQPTMYDVRTNAHDYGVSLIARKFKRRTWPALPMRTIWRDAAFARKTLFAHAPHHKAIDEAWALVDRVQKGLAA